MTHIPRPAPRIVAPNSAEALWARCAAALPRLAALPGVIGIVLSGGLARGYADQRSEIDLTLYLDPATFETWQAGQAPIALGISRSDGALFDIAIADIEAETARAWSPVEQWDRSYGQILY